MKAAAAVAAQQLLLLLLRACVKDLCVCALAVM
jgi:hypothetical protein